MAKGKQSGTSSDRSPMPFSMCLRVLCLASCSGLDMKDEDVECFRRRVCACVWVGQAKEEGGRQRMSLKGGERRGGGFVVVARGQLGN